MYTIYALIDPSDGLIRYVGMAQDLYSRFIQHINCESRNAEKNLWVTDCRSRNVMIQMRTLEAVETRDQALEAEKRWIEHYCALSMPLLNKAIVIGLRRNQGAASKGDEQLKQECTVLEKKRTDLKVEIRRQEERLKRIEETRQELVSAPLLNVALPKRKCNQEERRKSLFPQALSAWKSGHRTRRAMAQHLGITFYQADLLCKDIEEALGQSVNQIGQQR